jgi:5'-3' exonuclease
MIFQERILMKNTFLLVDTMNFMWRAAHVARGDTYDRAGLAIHIMLNSLPFTVKKFNVTHVVFCFEGYSWRKEIDSTYKYNRKVKESQQTSSEREFSTYLYELQSELREFIDQKTNATVLQHPVMEADDMIAGWIQNYPDDDHVILSTDSDFQQLIAPNVIIYNGVDKKITRHTGIFDENDKPFKSRKGEVNTDIPDPEFYLFQKIIRGDAGDNIKPSFPGARMKGSKNKVGIMEAYEDRHTQGFAWNNFMNSTWTDENNIDHLVKDKFEHNKILIDLTKQPEPIREALDDLIQEVEPKSKQLIGVHFLKFCGKHNLIELSKYSDKVVDILSKKLK